MFFLKKKAVNRKVTKRPRLYRMSRSVLDWLSLGLKMLATVLVVAGLYHFLLGSTYFTIKSVQVTGPFEKISQNKILKLANVPLGKNLLMVNLHEIGQNIKKHPWVKQVYLRRRFPSDVVIEVTEHKSAAYLETQGELGAKTYLMSDEGLVFLNVASREADLPVITGFNEEQLRKYPHYFSVKVADAFLFIKTFESEVGPGDFTLQSVRYDLVDGVMANLTKKSDEFLLEVPVFFGRDNFLKKMNVWKHFAKNMREQNTNFTKVDLHVGGKIFATTDKGL